jgi:serine/threonine protein kinase
VIVEGRYRLGPRLGRGGMADVFEAWDLRLERKVAIKRYRSAAHGAGLRRFMSEGELLAGLSHPGLLTVFDVSFDGERPFLVLRLAKGGTLRDRLDTGTLGFSRVAEIGAAVADVLAYIHAQGIVHRDVKPSNVLFDEQGDCFLADFGIAKAIGSAQLTDSKEFVGTAAYLAPEQVEGATPGPAVDIYSLGLVLLECLTGHTEYHGSDIEMAVARLSRPPRVPGAWGPEWQAVLTAMTATDPAERPDAEQCAAMLRALETGQTLQMAMPLRRRSRRRAYAGAGAAAAAVLAAIAFAASPIRLFGGPTADPTQQEHTADVPQQSTSDTKTPVEVAQQAPETQQQPPPTQQADVPAQTGPAADRAGAGDPGPKGANPPGGEGVGHGKGAGKGSGKGSGKGAGKG